MSNSTGYYTEVMQFEDERILPDGYTLVKATVIIPPARTKTSVVRPTRYGTSTLYAYVLTIYRPIL